jgi:phosphatidylglycerophosphatase A
LPIRIALLTVLFFVGAQAAMTCEGHYACKDPGQVVIDELLGQWTSLLFLSSASSWLLGAAFFLFRIFDIIKPWPIRSSEQWLPGGYGVMIDDLLAGLLAAGILFLIQ